MKPVKSPYEGLHQSKWLQRTEHLVAGHPLGKKELIEVVIQSWEAIFDSRIGAHGFQIGKDLFPVPQIMGFFIHELIALELTARHKGLWRGNETADEKDLVYLPNPKYSVEIKTSSHKSQIFGNRSYAQANATDWKKSKSGYYLAVNFEKFAKSRSRPKIQLIRFGWIDHTDWIGQAAATGQQARVDPEADKAKLLVIYAA